MIGDDDLGDLFHHSEEEEETGNQEANEGNEPANDEGAGATNADAKPKRKVIRKPHFKLDPVRLCGSRGIPVLPDAFKNITLKGKGNEREDVNKVIKVLEHWGHRLYPKLRFDDLLEKIETLGKKKPVQVCVKKIRLDMPLNVDDEIIEPVENPEPDVVPVDNDALFDTLRDDRHEQEDMFPNSPVFDNTNEIL